MIAFRHFYRDDLLKLSATIADYAPQTTFLATIVDNTHYHSQTPDGRVAIKLYEGPDWEWVIRLEETAGFQCSDVSRDLEGA